MGRRQQQSTVTVRLSRTGDTSHDVEEQMLRTTVDGIEPCIRDITADANVAAVAERVARASRPLRALVNNAGVAINAPLEIMPIAQWR